MATGVESFGSAAELGAIYPFVGTEGLLVFVGFVIWIAWHIWELKHESKEYQVEKEELKDKAHNVNVFDWEIAKFK
jgi:hypothetical protein